MSRSQAVRMRRRQAKQLDIWDAQAAQMPIMFVVAFQFQVLAHSPAQLLKTSASNLMFLCPLPPRLPYKASVRWTEMAITN